MKKIRYRIIGNGHPIHHFDIGETVKIVYQDSGSTLVAGPVSKNFPNAKNLGQITQNVNLKCIKKLNYKLKLYML